MRSCLVIALLCLLAAAYCQDSFNVPTELLADINPGPDSSDPSPLRLIESAGKAYASVTITGKIFPQLVVTDGTYEGTKLLSEFTTDNRGDPYKDDPFWNGGYAPIKDLTVFDEILWFQMYNYNSKGYILWSVNPVDDIPQPRYDTIFASISGSSSRSISQVIYFKNEKYLLDTFGLCKLSQDFSSCSYYNDTSAYILGVPQDGFFDGFTSGSLKLISNSLMLLTGDAFGYSGLWTFDGSTFKLINIEAYTYTHFTHDNSNKYYYSARWEGYEQLFVYEPSANKNFTVLTDLKQSCSECFKDLTPMSDNKIAFIYNSQIGTSDGTIAGTSLLVGYPRVSNVVGAFEGRVYCNEYYTEDLLSTDGTVFGTRNVTSRAITRTIFTFNGDAFFGTVRAGYEGDFWRISSSSIEAEMIRGNVTGWQDWTEISLPNGNKQQYVYYYASGSNRGVRYNYFWLYVTDGNGIVRYTADLSMPMPPPVFLNNRFIMPYSNAGAGKELFYMEPAPESYETPVPAASASSVLSNALWLVIVALGLVEVLF